MKKISISLIALALAASCSSAKVETTPDEPVKEVVQEAPAPVEVNLADAIKKAYEAHSAGDHDATMAFFADDTSWEGAGMPTVEGKEGVAQVLAGFKSAMSDQAVSARRIFVAPDAKITVTQGSMKGTNDGPLASGAPATGKAAANDFLHIQWWNDEGQITRTWTIDNGTTVPKMLGLMPVPKGTPAPAVAPWPTETEVVEASDNQANIDALNAFVDAAVKNDLEAYGGFFAENYTGAAYGSHELESNKEKSLAWLAGMHKSFTEGSVENVHGWAFGDHVVGVYKVSMKHTGAMGPIKATKKVVSMHFVDVATIADGKMVRVESYSNPAELMAQIMPPPATAMNQ